MPASGTEPAASGPVARTLIRAPTTRLPWPRTQRPPPAVLRSLGAATPVIRSNRCPSLSISRRQPLRHLHSRANKPRHRLAFGRQSDRDRHRRIQSRHHPGPAAASLELSARRWRMFRCYKGQRRCSGSYWSATARSHWMHESHLELARLLFGSNDMLVHNIVAQPFLLKTVAEVLCNEGVALRPAGAYPCRWIGFANYLLRILFPAQGPWLVPVGRASPRPGCRAYIHRYSTSTKAPAWCGGHCSSGRLCVLDRPSRTSCQQRRCNRPRCPLP